tara:strand:+ start:6639 stop:7745 length:1107 start_codon:yes stop_codon:yes gene_type:complete
LIKVFKTKIFFRFFYQRYSDLKVFIEIFLNLYLRKNKTFNNKTIKIYYAGAEIGNIGGPYLKIKKLQTFFPENKRKYNIVYALSNAPKLTSWSIKIIKKRNIPLILNQNGVFYPSWYKGNWENQNLRVSKVYHSADYVFWQSNFCKKASEIFLGKRFGKGEILYNAVDTKSFSPVKRNRSKIFKLLTTGNIRKQNNYRIQSLLEAVEEIVKINENVHLYIAGIVEDLNYFKREIESLKIRKFITFLGPYNQIDAPLIYQKVDAYITMSYQDNCPSAVIEAMSSGLPILYSSSGGIPELVGENCGVGLKVEQDWKKIHVPKKEYIVEGFFKVTENRKIMSNSSRNRAVELFDLNYWIKRHKEVFDAFIP